MNEKPESEEFDDEEVEEILEAGDDVDVDRVIRDIDQARRRGAPKQGDPAWRRLERMREDKRTAELTIAFDAYDIGLDDGERPKRKARG